MIVKRINGKTVAFLPTWRLIVVLGMYCMLCVEVGALIIFTIEQQPIHPIGQALLLCSSIVFLVLAHRFGKIDLKRMRAMGAQLEVTRAQSFVVIFCCAMVPGTLLFLVILSGV